MKKNEKLLDPTEKQTKEETIQLNYGITKIWKKSSKINKFHKNFEYIGMQIV